MLHSHDEKKKPTIKRGLCTIWDEKKKKKKMLTSETEGKIQQVPILFINVTQAMYKRCIYT